VERRRETCYYQFKRNDASVTEFWKYQYIVQMVTPTDGDTKHHRTKTSAFEGNGGQRTWLWSPFTFLFTCGGKNIISSKTRFYQTRFSNRRATSLTVIQPGAKSLQWNYSPSCSTRHSSLHHLILVFTPLPAYYGLVSFVRWSRFVEHHGAFDLLKMRRYVRRRRSALKKLSRVTNFLGEQMG
jgi:hypothetical protein